MLAHDHGVGITASPPSRPTPSAAPAGASPLAQATLPPADQPLSETDPNQVRLANGGLLWVGPTTVTPAAAMMWGNAYLTTRAAEMQALQQRDPGLLTRLVEPRVLDEVFGKTTAYIQGAVTAGATVSLTGDAHFQQMALVALSSDQKSAVRNAGGVAADYAMYITAYGPQGATYTDGAGAFHDLAVLPNDPVSYILVGTPQQDPVLGPIWRIGFSGVCASSTTAAHPAFCP